MFWRRILNDFIDDVFDLVEHFSSTLRYMALKFAWTNFIFNLTFNWTFTNASIWRTAVTFTVIPSWMVFLCIILISIFPIEVNFLHLDWVNLPSTIVAITLDNCCVQRFFESNWWLCSSEKRFSEWADYFCHQNFFVFGILALMLWVIMGVNGCDLMFNGGCLAEACFSSVAFSWLLEGLVELLILFVGIKCSIDIAVKNHILIVVVNRWSVCFEDSVIDMWNNILFDGLFDSHLFGVNGLVHVFMLKRNRHLIHLIQATIIRLLLSLRTKLRSKVLIVVSIFREYTDLTGSVCSLA